MEDNNTNVEVNETEVVVTENVSFLDKAKVVVKKHWKKVVAVVAVVAAGIIAYEKLKKTDDEECDVNDDETDVDDSEEDYSEEEN